MIIFVVFVPYVDIAFYDTSGTHTVEYETETDDITQLIQSILECSKEIFHDRTEPCDYGENWLPVELLLTEENQEELTLCLQKEFENATDC